MNFPICIHTGSGEPTLNGAAFEGLGATNMLEAFYSVVFTGLPKQFPRLRFGFIEAGSSWIPFVLDKLQARRERMAWAYAKFNYSNEQESLFRENRLFVTCQTLEDVPYILRFGTEDHLLLGTDYSHADQSADIESITTLRQWGEEGRISPRTVTKILEDNPREFYGLA
jgi:predicted TIM-barrel fold metal-dependent hydrolase